MLGKGAVAGVGGERPALTPSMLDRLDVAKSFIGESREPSIQQEEGSKQQEERAAKETA